MLMTASSYKSRKANCNEPSQRILELNVKLYLIEAIQYVAWISR
jgi:hypothetical protein